MRYFKFCLLNSVFSLSTSSFFLRPSSFYTIAKIGQTDLFDDRFGNPDRRADPDGEGQRVRGARVELEFDPATQQDDPGEKGSALVRGNEFGNLDTAQARAQQLE